MYRDELYRQYDFSGRTIAITGGAGALGSEMACALAGLGANVAVLDRAAEQGEKIVQRILSEGAPGRPLSCKPMCLTELVDGRRRADPARTGAG